MYLLHLKFLFSGFYNGETVSGASMLIAFNYVPAIAALLDSAPKGRIIEHSARILEGIAKEGIKCGNNI
jgi:hypothetical protein